MKKVVVMVGLPGSGKSTRVQEILGSLEDGMTSVVHSTDNYFMVDGEYVFEPKKLGYHHKLNQEAFKESLKEGVNLIVVDNTNLRARDRKAYTQPAQSKGYEVQYEVVGEFTEDFAKVCAERNTHGVPLDSILRMANYASLPEQS